MRHTKRCKLLEKHNGEKSVLFLSNQSNACLVLLRISEPQVIKNFRHAEFPLDNGGRELRDSDCGGHRVAFPQVTARPRTRRFVAGWIGRPLRDRRFERRRWNRRTPPF